jgi:hypothetical protein
MTARARANLHFFKALADRIAPVGSEAVSVHPGGFVRLDERKLLVPMGLQGFCCRLAQLLQTSSSSPWVFPWKALSVNDDRLAAQVEGNIGGSGTAV